MTSKCKVTTDEMGVNTYLFKNGETRVSDPFAAPANIQRKYTSHGDKQKHSDSFAACESPADCVEAWDRVHSSLMNGEWSQRGVAGEKQPSELVEAIATVKQMDVAMVAELVKNQSDEWKKAARKDAAVAVAIEEIKERKQRERTKAAKKLAKESPKARSVLDDIVATA